MSKEIFPHIAKSIAAGRGWAGVDQPWVIDGLRAMVPEGYEIRLPTRWMDSTLPMTSPSELHAQREFIQLQGGPDDPKVHDPMYQIPVFNATEGDLFTILVPLSLVEAQIAICRGNSKGV